MSSAKNLVEFPDVEAKLQKAPKQSAFEKQRAEAEAKKAREAAETAAVYQDFVKSFDHDDDDHDANNTASRYGGSLPPQRPPKGPGFAPIGGGAGASKRHFGASALKSGPGSLGPAPGGLRSGPGSLGPSPGSFGRKRGFDAYKQEKDGRLGFEDREEPLSVAKVFNNSDDEDEGKSDSREDMAVARPTLRLSQLPPGTSPAFIKSLIPANMTVENVKILPPVGQMSSERKSAVAIVTLSQETPATDMDAAVSSLQNRYLGYGFNLSLHRHLSSAVANATTSALSSTSAASQPFGAKPVAQQTAPGNAATQQSFHRGFAPPSSYGPNAGSVNRSNLLHVPVKPPNDIKMLQLINKTIESVLAHGVEFEALLMTRPEVQREEKWAWIWDARSEGGIWYRWRLWEIITGSESRRNKGRYLPLFDGSHAWKAPEKSLPFEFVTKIDEFVSDSEYNSSDDEDFDGENREGQGAEAEATFLNPLDKAKLTHLLSRLPTTLSKIRKGDIARVTTFALTHASRGVEEVVDMIASNIEKPFALTAANPEFQSSSSKEKTRQRDDSEASEPEPEEKADKEGPDTSAASLVGLYVVSDILSASSNSGIQRAWRYRQLFEGALKERKIFEGLGQMAERLNWGRMRAEKWKRSVGLVLGLWEGWCVFPAETQELFVGGFENPPPLKARAQTQDNEDDDAAKKAGGRWKLVEASTPSADVTAAATPELRMSEKVTPDRDDDVEGEPMDEEDVVGEPMEDDDVAGEPMEDDVVGEPMSEEDVEGEPMVDDVEGEPMKEDDADNPVKDQQAPNDAAAEGDASMEGAEGTHTVGRLQLSSKPTGQGRKRMRAVDMFADSGDSDEGS